MTDEIAISPEQLTELQPLLEQHAQAQQMLIRSARMIIVSAGESPDRYMGQIVGKPDGTAVIPLAPLPEAQG